VEYYSHKKEQKNAICSNMVDLEMKTMKGLNYK